MILGTRYVASERTAQPQNQKRTKVKKISPHEQNDSRVGFFFVLDTAPGARFGVLMVLSPRCAFDRWNVKVMLRSGT